MSSYHPWPYHSSLVQPSPSLAEEVNLYAGLQLPPANDSPPSSAIDRYVKDLPTGAIVTHDTRNLRAHQLLMLPSEIAYSNMGSQHQHSSLDQVENESLSDESDSLRYPASSESLEESEYRHQSSVSTSSEYADALGKPFGQDHHFMPRASNLDAPVDPDLAPSRFVCPKSVHISNADGQGPEGHAGFTDDDGENDYGYPQTGPNMFRSCYDRVPGYYGYSHPTPPMGIYSQQPDHSLNHDHSSPSPPCSRQGSPTAALKLKENRSRRTKCTGMMKPFPAGLREGEKGRKPRSEKTRGRGAGKKAKERKVCREHPSKVFTHASDYKKHMNQQHLRPFLCVFYFAGCNQTFGSKNEWKRHVNSQHLQLSYWHCDDSLCADRKAIFNRKDLFGQHLKRMHPAPAGTKATTVSYMEEVIERCRVERRKPPQESRCGYCEQLFSGPQGWEQRMEHVGQHYEKNNYKEISRDRWVPDSGLIIWALELGIIEENSDGTYTIVSTGKDAIVKAGVEQKKLAKEEMARAQGYANGGDEGDMDVDFDDERDGEGEDDDYPHI